MAGGQPGITPIEFITIATTGNSQDFGELIDSQRFMGTGSSATRGVWMGGRTSGSPSGSQHVQYIQIQTLGNATDFGQLLAAKDDLGGCSDCIRALAYGGGSNVIEYLTIATGGDTVDFGDGQTSSGYTCLSNGHGGL